MALALDTRLGPYEITGQIGAGGMGEVYRANDTNLGRDVAIRCCRRPSRTERAAGAFRARSQDARLAESSQHRHIYGLEKSDGGVLALVMELVEGPTLADRIAQGPIPVDEAVPIARQIAEALEAAHEQGIIHRDLKPANIKVREDGTVKVLDFGLGEGPRARGGWQSPTPHVADDHVSGDDADGRDSRARPRTWPRAGARVKAADKRSDVWAFGCVLFEMVTGRRAFEGEDISDTLAAVLRGEPDWTALPAIAPPEIRTLIEGCLTKDWKERIASISTVRVPLDKRRVLAVAAPAAFQNVAPMETGVGRHLRRGNRGR